MFYAKNDLKNTIDVKFVSNYQSKSPSVCNDFRDSLGEYWVCLMVNNNELKDTVCHLLNHRFICVNPGIPIFTVYKNEKDSISQRNEWKINSIHLNIVWSQFLVYDRYGVIVFCSDNHAIGLNGTMNNQGEKCDDGTYYYLCRYREGDSLETKVLNSSLRLMNEKY
jgi:hypothetical protein